MHLRASRTLWLQTPGRNGSVLQANSPAHQERVEKVNDFLKTGRISIWNNSFRAQIRMRMHLRAPRTLWFLGAAPRPRPQWQCATVSPVHQEKVKKVNCFLKTGRISVWNNTFRAQIRLRMHLWASSTFLASGGRSRPPDPPSRNGSVPRAGSPAHQKRVKNCQLFSPNRTNFIIWNHLFGPQIRVIMHLRASTTLSPWQPPLPQPQWQCATGGWPLCANGIRILTP